MIVATVASTHRRIKRPAGKHQIERIRDGIRIRKHERTLPEVVQEQPRKHDREPVYSNNVAHEVAFVCIERFGPCQNKEDRSENVKSGPAMLGNQAEAVGWVQRLEHLRILENMGQAGQPDDRKPDDHDGAEKRADTRRAPALQNEKTGENPRGDGDDIRLEDRRRDLEPLDGAQDRDRGRDDTVAVEKRSANQADQDCGLAPSVHLQRRDRKRGQRHDAALAVICGSHDDQHILDRHDDNERPEDQRHATKDDGSKRLDIACRMKRLLIGIERACAYVAENDTQRADERRLSQRRLLGFGYCRGCRHRAAG